MRVGRLLRSTEGVGAESHRVAGWHRVAGSRTRGVAESQRIAQTSRLVATCWRSLVLWVVSKQSVAEFLLCAECRVVTVYLSENDTERYVKAHVVVKLQLDHKLAHRKSARRLHKKPQKEHVLARRRQHCNIDPQKAHVVGGVRKRTALRPISTRVGS